VTDFAGHGEVRLGSAEAEIDMGAMLAGMTWTNASQLPTKDYEISLEAMKTVGGDFFCGLTFPVGTNFCSLIMGGWGGGVVGISSINGQDASENETFQTLYFEPNRWFIIKLRMLEDKLNVWLDGKQIIDLDLAGKSISLRPGEIYKNVPLGISTFQTGARIRKFSLKKLEAPGK